MTESPVSLPLLADLERELLSNAPIADVLRKVLLLGGRVGSAEIRAWATRELRGYSDETDLPEYRQVFSRIYIDAFVGMHQISGQPISLSGLPEDLRPEQAVPLRQGIGEIAEMASSHDVSRFSVAGGLEISQYLNLREGNPNQRIIDMYYLLGASTLRGVVDHVRTILAGLISELRAVTPQDADAPTPADTAQLAPAISVVLHGSRNRVSITHSPTNSPGVEAPTTRTTRTARSIFGIIVGCAGIVGTIAGVAVWLSPSPG